MHVKFPNAEVEKWFFLGLSFLLYVSLAYWVERSSFLLLFAFYSLAMVCYLKLVSLADAISFKKLLLFGLVLRAAFLFAIPAWSDDYFRFLFDGSLFLSGENPYLILPQNWEPIDAFQSELVSNMNSPQYFTIYPPISQYVYALSALPGSTIAGLLILRLVLILGDCLALLAISKLAGSYKIPKTALCLFFLNPLIIIELSGNLHFEGLLLAALLWSIYFLKKNNFLAALGFTAAVGIKLFPLMYLPSFVFSLRIRKPILFFLSVVLVACVISLPFIGSEVLSHFQSSFDLYFQSFEFNASVYYLLRWVGYKLYGYNTIATLGKSLAIVSFLGIMLISWMRRIDDNPFIALTLISSLYLLLSTTVHPWYVLLPLTFGLLSGLAYPILWSYLVVLSYAAYINVDYLENLWLVGIEYLLLSIFALIELFHYFKRKENVARKA